MAQNVYLLEIQGIDSKDEGTKNYKGYEKCFKLNGVNFVAQHTASGNRRGEPHYHDLHFNINAFGHAYVELLKKLAAGKKFESTITYLQADEDGKVQKKFFEIKMKEAALTSLQLSSGVSDHNVAMSITYGHIELTWLGEGGNNPIKIDVAGGVAG